MEIERQVLDETMPVTGGYATAEDPVSLSREAHVKLWIERIESAKKFWQPEFDRMREDQDFARGLQWERLGVGLSSKDLYTANIVLRHIQQRVSALYAKNPRFIATLKPRVDYTAWDGKIETVEQVLQKIQLAAQTGTPPEQINPNDLAIIEDFNRVMIRREMLRRIGRTLEVAFEHYIGEQRVPFKKQVKRLVRRTLTTGVGYIKLDFQRVMQMRPEIESQIADASQRLATIERLAREHALGDFDEHSAEFDRLQSLIKQLQMEPGILVREGLVFEFPSSTSIIPDMKCTNLDGFQGCDWIAEEFFLTPDDIKEVYDVDVSKGFRPYVCIDKGKKRFSLASEMRYMAGSGDMKYAEQHYAHVYVIWCKRDGLVYVVCEGYRNFLKEPEAPAVYLERFWPIFTLMFNESDHEEDVFPLSDVYLLRHPQLDYNRARQALREHRQANRPKTYVGADRLSEEDQLKLQSHPANAVIELEGLLPGEKIEDLLQPHKPPPIDPALYDTSPSFDDVMRVVGTQEANLGGTSNATATESSIAESSRLSSLSSNVDDLDEFLTEVARAAGQILMENCSEVTIRRIVGEGAVWPKQSREEIVEEIFLSVAAGSSGRPNQAQEIQNFERMVPLLLQIPGIRPSFLAREGLQRLDDKIDLSEALAPSLPSIMSLNRQMQVTPMVDSERDPNQQGAQGGLNAPQPVRPEGDTAGVGRPPMDPNLDGVASVSGMALN